MDENFGWPLIPTKDDKPLEELKVLVRAYVTATYREFYGFQRGKAFLQVSQARLLTTAVQQSHGGHCLRTQTMNT
jgi:hypothetical protein